MVFGHRNVAALVVIEAVRIPMIHVGRAAEGSSRRGINLPAVCHEAGIVRRVWASSARVEEDRGDRSTGRDHVGYRIRIGVVGGPQHGRA
jgi:hypothetical protein